MSDEHEVLWWHTKIRCHKHFVTSVTYFGCWVLRMNAATNNATLHTTRQLMMNAKFSQQRIRHCQMNRLLKTIQGIPHNLHCVFQVVFPLLWVKASPQVYPNPHLREPHLKLAHNFWDTVEITLMCHTPA